ncbi:acyltransferase family protein [Bizionia sediminis]|uniref:Acyltransferase family protein n=1 Tax=Bizionia sediminis TaxID=1737064 RepID=A0ABW5KWX8_9FLAO
MANLKESKRIPNLTPIRFILALLVVIFHIPQFSENRGFPFFNDLPIFHKGTEAVYMFFSLSGFLIIKQLFDEKKHTNSINLKGFYKRRILRIFPLYYLVLTIGFLYYQLVLPFFGFEFDNNYNLLTGILLSVTFFANIFSTYAPGGILEILWSIGIEEQFYLFIAPVFLLLPLKRIILFLVAFTAIYFLIYFSEYAVFLKKYNMLFFYFSSAGLCAIIHSHNLFQTLIKKLQYPILIVVILYFTTGIFTNNFNPFFYNLFSFIVFGLTISVLATKPIKILQNKTMEYLGKISYGIYMYHAIIMQLVGFIYLKVISKFGFQNTFDIISINLSVIALTIIIAHVSYKYYESYFLNLKRKKSIKPIVKTKPLRNKGYQ